MKNRKCYYFTEGQCEEQLIKALKSEPALLMPGKIKIFNVIQNELPVSILMSLDPSSQVILVFDTDINVTEHLKKNIELLKKNCAGVDVITIAQVMNFEDEIVRSTNVSKAQNLTKSKSSSGFKSAVCRMKPVDFRRTLERHDFDISHLCAKRPPEGFRFITQGSVKVKQ